MQVNSFLIKGRLDFSGMSGEILKSAVISLLLIPVLYTKMVSELRKSPYRNYIKRTLPETECVVYFMLLYPKEIIDKMYSVLKRNGITEELKVL